MYEIYRDILKKEREMFEKANFEIITLYIAWKISLSTFLSLRKYSTVNLRLSIKN